MFHNPDVPGLGGARQMRSKASCSSANTDVAPMKQKDDAEERGHHALARLAHAFEEALHGQRARRAEQFLELLVDLAAGGVFAEGDAGDRNHDEQQRGDREHRVEGQRGTHALGVVLHPVDGSSPEQTRNILVDHRRLPQRSAGHLTAGRRAKAEPRSAASPGTRKRRWP
jgi:hypothetical protein